MSDVTPEMIRAARKAAHDADILMPFMARIADYPDRDELRAADAEAERLNDEAIRQVLQAALDARE